MHIAEFFLPGIRDILATNAKELPAALEEFHAVDIADIYKHLDEEESKVFISSLPLELQTECFESLEHKDRLQVITQLPSGRAARLLEQISPDDRVDFLQELPENVREALIATVDRNIARDIRALLNYPPDTAGGIMTTEVLKVPEYLSVDQCLTQIRKMSAEQEMIYTVYIIDDENGQLNGVVSLRDILMSKGDVPITDVMTSQVISVRYDAPQDEVAELISKYDLLALPVIDHHGRLLGMITVDDILDVVKEEQGEDIQRIGAMQPIEESYFDASFFSLVRKRASWLVCLFLGEMFTSTALKHYEGTFQAVATLVMFIPLVISSGGNSGSQSSTLVIRSLTMGELSQGRMIMQLLRREALMGVVLGVILGVVGFFRAFAWGNPWTICLTVSATLVLVVLLGTLVGTMLPLLFRRLGFDPAVSSAPFIASLVDVLGLVAYFNVAKLILGL